jgi:hypothetical protein
MPTATITVRLPEWLDQELRETFAQNGDGPSEGLRRVVEEWWVSRNLPLIEYRPSWDGPRPSMKDGPELWSFIMNHKAYEGDLDRLSRHYGGLTEEDMKQALAYYELFPETVDAHLAENDRIARIMMDKYER